jgi:GNAT superfamily N-acetyltransferase
VYVAPAGQAQGIGSALLERTLSRFPDAQCVHLEGSEDVDGRDKPGLYEQGSLPLDPTGRTMR